MELAKGYFEQALNVIRTQIFDLIEDCYENKYKAYPICQMGHLKAENK